MTEELRSVLEAPERVRDLRADDVTTMFVEAVALQTRLALLTEVLLTRLVTRAEPDRASDRLLQVDEAAAILGVDGRWIRRRARVLPFVRRLSGKAIRVSEEGLRRWVAIQRAA